LIKDLLQRGETLVKEKSPALVATARKKTQHMLQPEIDRLKALHGVNPNVREEEIRYFESQLAAVTEALDSASPRLDGLRVMVAV
jgi:ATP-dependent helicase HepA